MYPGAYPNARDKNGLAPWNLIEDGFSSKKNRRLLAAKVILHHRGCFFAGQASAGVGFGAVRIMGLAYTSAAAKNRVVPSKT